MLQLRLDVIQFGLRGRRIARQERPELTNARAWAGRLTNDARPRRSEAGVGYSSSTARSTTAGGQHHLRVLRGRQSQGRAAK